MWLKALIVILPTLPKFQKTFIYYSLLIYNLYILFFEKMVRMVRHHAKTLIYRHFAPLPKPLPNPYQPYRNKRCSMYESNFHAYCSNFSSVWCLFSISGEFPNLSGNLKVSLYMRVCNLVSVRSFWLTLLFVKLYMQVCNLALKCSLSVCNG